MKKNWILPEPRITTTLMLQLVGVIASGIGECRADSAADSFPPGVLDVVKLAKAGLNEDVILAQIKNAGTKYTLSVDQIIYLHQQGVTQNEISALLGGGSPAAPGATPSAAGVSAPAAPQPAVPLLAPSGPPVAPAATAPFTPPADQPPPVTIDDFRTELSPYGTWVDVPGSGLCWQPRVELTNPFWRPYFDQGHWAYTTDGWSWQSDYPWGDVVFHYGRWFRSSRGWLWVPGHDWAPAWVSWRHAEGFCGWAPLPPDAVFRPGVGLWFGGRSAVDVDFGLRMDAFTFVPYDHFWGHDLHAFLLPPERLRIVFGRSVILNGYRFDHGRFIVEGLGRERMAALTHHEIRVEETTHRDISAHERMGMERREIHDERKDRDRDRGRKD